jgi:hypothetical protein
MQRTRVDLLILDFNGPRAQLDSVFDAALGTARALDLAELIGVAVIFIAWALPRPVRSEQAAAASEYASSSDSG